MKESLYIPIFYYICANNNRRCIMADSFLPLYLRSLILKNYKCFNGDYNFDFFFAAGKKEALSQCTVILGDNGTGKTNILKAIANLEPCLNSVKDVDGVEGIIASIGVQLNGKDYGPKIESTPKYKPIVIERHLSNDDYLVECDFLKLNNKRSNLKKSSFTKLIRHKAHVPEGDRVYLYKFNTKYGYTSRVNFIEPTEDLKNLKIDAYGTNRHSVLGSQKIENNINSESLFYTDNRLIDIETWLFQLDLAKRHKTPGASRRFRLVRDLIRCSSLFPNVTDIKIGFDEKMNGHLYFIIDDNELKLNDLGYGYQCMFSWIFDFTKKMFDRYPNSNNPLKEPAVLLIDEIDMHLHPNWQRCIITELCGMFPNTQFIVTTHSPLVIQSISQINLYVLSKKGGKIEVDHYPNTSFQGWTVEEILSDIMKLQDNIRSDRYLSLLEQLNSALQGQDTSLARSVYEELSTILHPNSIDREIYPMQIEAIHDHD